MSFNILDKLTTIDERINETNRLLNRLINILRPNYVDITGKSIITIEELRKIVEEQRIGVAIDISPILSIIGDLNRFIPPENAINVDESNSPITLNPGDTDVEILKISNPSSKLVIHNFGQAASTGDAFDYIQWTIRTSTGEIEPYTNFVGQIAGILDHELYRFPVPIVIDKNETIYVYASLPSTAPSPYSVVSRLKGYRYNV